MTSPGQLIAVAFLDVLGLCLNMWFLYTVKTRQSPYNAIDILQALKTGLVILALLSSVWLDLVTCSSAENDTTTLVCIGSKAIIEDTLFHSVCFTFLTVACIRRKVCQCRGRADVLVTTSYALKTLLFTFIPAGMFITAMVSLVANYNDGNIVSDHRLNVTVEEREFGEMPNNIRDLLMSEYSQIMYGISHAVIMNVIPLVISCVMYVNIVHTVKRTAMRTDGYVSQRSRSPTKAITLSVVILMTCTLSMWCIYIITSVVAIFTDVSPYILAYLKLTILIVHPFGEGLLQPSARKQGDRVHKAIQERSSRQVCLEKSPTRSSCCRDEEEIHSLVEFLPALIEERESTRESGNSTPHYIKMSSDQKKVIEKIRRESVRHPRPSVLVKNAPMIGLEYREEPTIVTLTKKRRESEERLKQSLKHVEGDERSPASYRKLSRCLGMSIATDVDFDDDIYEDYKKRYSTSSRKLRQNLKRSPPPTIEEYKGISYAHSRNEDIETSSPISKRRNPSQKRWWKVLTTAKMASRFSSSQRHQKTIIDKVQPPDSYNTDVSGKPDQEVKFPSRSTENDAQTKRPKRSMSTTKNEWLLKNGKQTYNRERNRSVSFISNIVVDNNASCSSDYPRSFSYDGKISVNYGNPSIDLKGLKHLEQIHRSNQDRDKSSKSSLVVTDTTSREDCIKKLQQWKDYF